jgi:uncharacterized repeat protein (TIGR03803 family)
MKTLLTVISSALLVFSALCTVAQASDKLFFLSFDNANGAIPEAGLIADSQGNLYGTTAYGGKYNFGNVFEVTRSENGSWQIVDLYDFTGGPDGGDPLGGVVLDASGNLYGTTSLGGQGKCVKAGSQWFGCGLVFELSHVGSTWQESVLFNFLPGVTKGIIPSAGLVFDKVGNLYGTTWAPGIVATPTSRPVNTFWGCNFPGCGGTVFELSPTSNGWKETDIYAFTGASDGSSPQANLVFDDADNLYGTTYYGGNSGYGFGVVFELSPNGTGWKETVLHTFTGQADGKYPQASVLIGSAGELYGTATAGGDSAQGTVFEITPGSNQFSVLHSFTGGADGGTPYAAVISDALGNLYGTTFYGGDGGVWGVVYQLTPSHGNWTETVLHTFQLTEGANPWAPLLMGPDRRLYGTTANGGSTGTAGTVFELLP